MKIDPLDGTVTFPSGVRLYACMPLAELHRVPGCRRSGSMDNWRWYSVDDVLELAYTTAHTTDDVLSSVTLTSRERPHSIAHHTHTRIAERSLGEPTHMCTNPEWWGEEPPFRIYPAWELPWGKVVAAWDGRRECGYLSVRYAAAPRWRHDKIEAPRPVVWGSDALPRDD